MIDEFENVVITLFMLFISGPNVLSFISYKALYVALIELDISYLEYNNLKLIFRFTHKIPFFENSNGQLFKLLISSTPKKIFANNVLLNLSILLPEIIHL